MARYAVTFTGRTGWDAHLTEQRYEVTAENAEAAIEVAQDVARTRYQYEHADSGTGVAEELPE